MRDGNLYDNTLFTEAADFFDPLLLGGTIPGQGMAVTFQQTIGFKRTAYCIYTGQHIDGAKAIELGIANKMLQCADLLPRAWELAN